MTLMQFYENNVNCSRVLFKKKPSVHSCFCCRLCVYVRSIDYLTSAVEKKSQLYFASDTKITIWSCKCTYQSVFSRRQIYSWTCCWFATWRIAFYILFFFCDHFIILSIFFFLDSVAFRGEATNAKESSWILMCLWQILACAGVAKCGTFNGNLWEYNGN